MEYIVSLEIDGIQHKIGNISGTGYEDACFAYLDTYFDMESAVPISISLPLQKDPFSAERTRCFFNGLLPEGFTRTTIAQRMHYDDNDYLSILYALGQECIGAIRISKDTDPDEAYYEKIDRKKIEALASEGATASADIVARTHLSLAGASGKVGLYYDRENDEWYLPHGLAPSTHIVKQSHVRLDSIVLNEQLSLMTASKCGIDTPDSQIIELAGHGDEELLLAVERYDRVFSKSPKSASGLPIPHRLHQEDFAQALGIRAEDKYETDGRSGYAKAMFDLIGRNCVSPIEDQMKLVDRMIFNLCLGNTDSHIKNHSVVYNEKARAPRLAPAYDVICTTMYDSSTRELSISLGRAGIIDEVTRDSFAELAGDIGIREKVVLDRYDRILDMFEGAVSSSAKELCDRGFTNAASVADRILLSRKSILK